MQIQQEKEKAELNAIIKLLKMEKDKRTKPDIFLIKDYVFDTKENNDDLLDFVMKFEVVKNKMEELLDKPKK